MSKYDSLLKKTELFEKLAMYGDRKSFLQAIAQENPVAQFDQAIVNFLQPLAASNIPSEMKDRAVDINRFIKENNYNKVLEIMKELLDTTKYPISADSLSWKSMAESYTAAVRAFNTLKTKYPAPPAQSEATTVQQTVQPSENVTLKQPAQYPPISKETQNQLNELLVPAGNILPLKLDGRLGPSTQKALDIFKAKYRTSGTPESVKKIYDFEKQKEQMGVAGVTSTPLSL